ncbi:hypothetical protein RRG08_056763 [Elysia crispata]|uniref:Uncharacterized protein n=1 Tax=Elysia crispata TaxID=231223 RepID=A0AAE1B8B6_9GAST|nr:hypothetical protein RRG08_056763 [Elysia crispata]
MNRQGARFEPRCSNLLSRGTSFTSRPPSDSPLVKQKERKASRPVWYSPSATKHDTFSRKGEVNLHNTKHDTFSRKGEVNLHNTKHDTFSRKGEVNLHNTKHDTFSRKGEVNLHNRFLICAGT